MTEGLDDSTFRKVESLESAIKESDLHPKVKNDLLSAYRKVQWQYRADADNQRIQQSAHLRSALKSLERVIDAVESDVDKKDD